ncbi:transforming acidic coiled-coil-containing protein 3-like [Pipistrellus kuhlii]|uniref:transforming acidic coiled-coil-containing protein 3-like n=1 Tax=Pipistrellus kuhlii TaxID=59472 RepID=UPI001E271253|nr:transforming acidic coiled-coil-containing protein 3-like [Pipistrellus kuhlii]
MADCASPSSKGRWQLPHCRCPRAPLTLPAPSYTPPNQKEESLKCAEDYIARVQKEGQRYQALKAHVEENLRLANEEIAQVRSKAQAEALAFQVSLQKEQLRVQSLEKALEQKVGVA